MFVQAWRVPIVTGGLQVNWPSPDSRTAGARGSVGEEMYRGLRCRGFTLPLRTSKYVQIWIGPQCANVTLRREWLIYSRWLWSGPYAMDIILTVQIAISPSKGQARSYDLELTSTSQALGPDPAALYLHPAPYRHLACIIRLYQPKPKLQTPNPTR